VKDVIAVSVRTSLIVNCPLPEIEAPRSFPTYKFTVEKGEVIDIKSLLASESEYDRVIV